jgi:GNAT superfamily N-acetyltransferase
MAITEVVTLSGAGILPRLDDLAALRIAVFRDYPYLYDGDVGYERDYLKKYAASPGSVFVLAMDQGRIVGAATGLPLSDADAEFRAAFTDQGLDPARVFYFGESVLLPAWRGQGLGHAFFDGRERHAAALGYAVTVFCAVVRPTDHPARPAVYRPLDGFWQSRGYQPMPGVTARYGWRDVGELAETGKVMQFWQRGL